MSCGTSTAELPRSDLLSDANSGEFTMETHNRNLLQEGCFWCVEATL